MLLQILVPTPLYAVIPSILSYKSEQPLPPGTLVRVPLGARSVLGIVWRDEPLKKPPHLDVSKIKPIHETFDGIAPLSPDWLALVGFCASYYQRSLGEVSLGAIPAQLKKISREQLNTRIANLEKKKGLPTVKNPPLDEPAIQESQRDLTQEQEEAVNAIVATAAPYLLFGATGSGKTEVYMQAASRLLHQNPKAQILVMVPEINLTPQLMTRFCQRFAHLGPNSVVCMNSSISEIKRLNHWLLAHMGAARIVLGTRLSIFSSMPYLSLIVVDEEHDPSYKSDNASRYSARDLAVYRAHLLGIPVVLGSATPSLETWYASRSKDEGGRYIRLQMSRIGSQHGHASGASFPELKLVDMAHEPKRTVISKPLLEAIKLRISRGEQSLLLLNQRGYAPVLCCGDCGWKSECPHCSAYRVFHKQDRTVRCHHCGFSEAVMRACPVCGNHDISPIGQGTERLEEHLTDLLGSAANIVRIDADSTRHKGELETLLNQVHDGAAEILIGTQMIAKGHDFRRITLVAALNPDGALFSSDYRAQERLFALLLQASGRAGRDAKLAKNSQMWVQTWQPTHPLYQALKTHDYEGFANLLLLERQMAGMPPFSSQALLRAEAKTQEAAQSFLHAVRDKAVSSEAHSELFKWQEHVTLMHPIPLNLQRVANVERAHMLIESPHRAALQRFLSAWQPALHQQKTAGLIRWSIDVDPLSI